MKNKYIDLIEQTFEFPQNEFIVKEGQLQFHNIDMMGLVKKFGTPLRFTYLPQISNSIQRAKMWFSEAQRQVHYKGDYHYSYCTKSSHFSFVLDEALKNDIHIETSSGFDIEIVKRLVKDNKLNKDKYVLCNGFKDDEYLKQIGDLYESGFNNCIPIIDNVREINRLQLATDKTLDIGIRIASEEEPKFSFYTSRLGIGYKSILPFYQEKIKNNERLNLKMLHFFINTGINDNAYYWNELTKCLKVYCELKKVCPSLDSLNIGGGFPIKKSLNFDYDYYYMVEEILRQIKTVCDENDIPEPHIFTEFGSYTVGESGGMIYQIIDQKQQNDREKWNMIDSSFMTTLPDTWAINQRFIMLPLNRWEDKYERVLLGGLTCDSDDYYNSEQHSNAIYLPEFSRKEPLFIGFFNTGAYQDSVSGHGGVHHCLIPQPKHVLIKEGQEGVEYEVFRQEQKSDEILKLLGY